MKDKYMISKKRYFIVFFSLLLLGVFYFFFTQNNSYLYSIINKTKNNTSTTEVTKTKSLKEKNTLQLQFINQQIKEIEQKLHKLQAENSNFNTINFNIKVSNMIQQEEKYRQSITEIEISKQLLDSLSKQIKSNKNLETLTVAGLGNSSEALMLTRILQELQTIVVKYKLLLLDYTENYPDVKKVKQQIGQYKKIIQNSIKRIQNNMSKRKTILHSYLQKEQDSMKKLLSSQEQTINLEYQLESNKKIYEYLLQKKIEIELINQSL